MQTTWMHPDQGDNVDGRCCLETTLPKLPWVFALPSGSFLGRGLLKFCPDSARGEPKNPTRSTGLFIARIVSGELYSGLVDWSALLGNRSPTAPTKGHWTLTFLTRSRITTAWIPAVIGRRTFLDFVVITSSFECTPVALMSWSWYSFKSWSLSSA